jgi:hypothetical protein
MIGLDYGFEPVDSNLFFLFLISDPRQGDPFSHPSGSTVSDPKPFH